MAFRGLYEHTIDAKGRTSVPARFRDALSCEGEAQLVVTTAFDGSASDGEGLHLHVYPLKAWEAFEAKLAQRSPSEVGVRQIYRTYVANAVDIEIDKLGRILLPPNLRKWGGLEKEIVWVGQLNRMELWSKARWEKASNAALDEEHQDSIEKVFTEIGL